MQLKDSRLSMLSVFLPTFVLATTVGAIVGLDNTILTALLAAGILGAVAIALPAWMIAAVLFVFTFLVQGTFKFFLGTNALGWAATGLSVLLGIRVFFESFGSNVNKSYGRSKSELEITLVFLCMYVAVFFVSLISSAPPLLQIASASKNAFPMLSILIAVYWLGWGEREISKLWLSLVVIAFLQLPLVVYQHFFVAASRASQGWDSVVGSMGGSVNGGGLNAMLVIFCLSALSLVLSRVKNKLSSSKLGWITTVVVFAIIGLGEVKAVFIWVPFVFLYFYGRKALTNPARVIGYAAVAGLALVTLFSVYQAMYWQGNKLDNRSAIEKIEKMSGYFFDTRNISYATGEISRAASIALWWNDSKSDILTRAIGFGPGSSKTISTLGQGEVAKRYAPLNIDSTSAAVYLWDTGIIGALSYLMFLISAIWSGIHLSKKNDLSANQRAILDASVVTVVLMSSLFIYNRTLTDEPAVQLLLYFSIGTILGLKRQQSVRTKVAAVL